ncbi:MAG: uroporphyrinogen decarboxylase family protein [Treponema sp.]|jgi:hypothetical protein|nr:uroporphyrinogen decarboxylase family protein [Treponema sp.]
MNDQYYTELLIKAAAFGRPEEIPSNVSMLPAVFLEYGDEVRSLIEKYPGLHFGVNKDYDPAVNTPSSYHKGQYTDPWGCVWSNLHEGMEAIVTGHPLPTRESVHKMKLPEGDAGLPHGFMYLRLLDLRGFEEMMVDFAEEPPELQMLIDKVLSYNLGQMEKAVAGAAGPIMFFGDDQGMQKGLAIGTERWRKYMKPCFSALYKLCAEAGKLVYMHTDGCIWEIIPDLAECGVAIVNPQYRANGLDNLVRVCKGKYPINLDLDRQLFPFASRRELQDHVMECVRALYLPEGGLGLNLEIGPDVNPETMDVLCNALDNARKYAG